MSDAARDEELRRTAAAWAMRLSEEKADAALMRDFEAWRRADFRHAQAFEETQTVWRKLAEARACPNDPAVEAAFGPPLLGERLVSVRNALVGFMSRTAWRPALGAAGAAALALAVVVFPLIGRQGPPATLDHRTAVAEVRDVTFDDGSVVTLGAATSLTVAFTAGERRVRLGEGEAFFSIEKDEARPFFVEAGDTVVRVVGTKFDIRRSTDEVRVAVLEGIVEVRDNTDDAAVGLVADVQDRHLLSAGEQAVSIDRGHRLVVADVGVAAPGAWRNGRLSYDNVALKEVVFDANRYFDGEIIIASDDLKTVEVTTSFQVDQIDTMIKTMELILPLRAEYRADGRVILRSTG